ncbi:hypothetical protein [uncultured Fibrobacter sp.]|uniref:hypothetical protein n=1 Tax=uncultured Fibrobacter sp. TaxID=261512 RepID=UPI0025DEB56C|nr:hypothetical protein [uncultured Fibrobacter sp.]
MISKKYILPIAAISMAVLAGCGDDSSSGAASNEIPASVKTLQEVVKLPCNEEIKCQKVLIEEHNDYMQCDGAQWQTVSETMPLAACSADGAPATNPASSSSEAAPAGDASSSSEAAPAGDASSSSEAAPAGDASSSSEAAPAGDASSSSEAAPAGDASSSSEAAPAGDASSSSEAAAAPAGGDMVSCDVPGAMGECMEYAAGTSEAQQLSESCVSVLQGTLGTGCAK